MKNRNQPNNNQNVTQEAPIRLRMIPPQLLQNCTNVKPEKYKFNNSNLTEIQTKIKTNPPYDAEKTKSIMETLAELQKTALAISKSEYGNIPLAISIPPPPKSAKVNNFVKINSDLVEIANKLCKFDAKQSYKGSLQVKPKFVERAPLPSAKDKKFKKSAKSSNASRASKNGNTSNIKPPTGAKPNSAEPEAYSFKEVSANTNVGPQPNVQVKLQNKSLLKIPPNPPIPDPAKGTCPFASMFDSEIPHTPLKGLKCPVPSQFKSNLESYITPTAINVGKFTNGSSKSKKKK